ncbi:hypothetical protein GCM10010211_24260 [Streptomyces albospinus]|uniref:Uncharacterized protein n=1 Tax=Streptomyces albospinus TaxID=285515 RepID=A0ABQ2UYW4_9ACTN|nr:hypothetical protein [Streptomyces albospinus]GGU58441.1 hypothetical protein GCM10010211_24260 [Streptomyces albospinus]
MKAGGTDNGAADGRAKGSGRLLRGRGGAPLIAPRVIGAPGMPRKVVRIAVVMAVNAGHTLVLTPHFRNALHYSALRTGLTFVPTALAHGAVGL